MLLDLKIGYLTILGRNEEPSALPREQSWSEKQDYLEQDLRLWINRTIS